MWALVCGDQGSLGAVCLIFGDKVSHWDLKFDNLGRPTGQQASGILLFPPAYIGITKCGLAHLAFSEVLGSSLV